MSCDNNVDRLYTVEELNDAYLRGRIDAIREFYKKSKEDEEREEIERLNGRL